jgi:hypothetical protein
MAYFKLNVSVVQTRDTMPIRLDPLEGGDSRPVWAKPKKKKAVAQIMGHGHISFDTK